MKDWLIIMIVVVVGLMFLTHSLGIPGLKGPNGGFSAFAATGQLFGMLMQWATFLIMNPAIIALAYLCKHSPTFRKLFPLGWIHSNLGITGFCRRFETLGEFSLAAMFKDPGRCAKIQGIAADLAAHRDDLVSAARADKKILGSDDAKLLLSSSDHLATLTPELAKATSIKEFGEALEEATKGKSPLLQGQEFKDLAAFCQGENPLLKSPKLVNAFAANKAVRATKDLANAAFAKPESMAAQAVAQKIDSSEEFVAFLCKNTEYLEGIHTALNIPKLEGKGRIGKRWTGVVELVTGTKQAPNTIKDKIVKDLKKALGGKVSESHINVLCIGIGDLTKKDLQSGTTLLKTLRDNPAIAKIPALAEDIGKVMTVAEDAKSKIASSLGEFGDGMKRGVTDAVEEVLKAVRE